VKPAYRIERLSKVYGSGETAVYALRAIDVEVSQGAMVVLLGPSGSGKSTFLNILGGLDQASWGHVLFGNADLTQFDEGALTEYRRRSGGFVFQFYNLIPALTGCENIALITEIAEAPMNPDSAAVVAGLQANDTVVLHPGDKVTEGARIVERTD
jgi:putative ABC transport system ATP-binding protein